jgi:hypothetical protein
MTLSRSQKIVLAMGALIVWSEEDRTKRMVSRRFDGKGDRANFRIGCQVGLCKYEKPPFFLNIKLFFGSENNRLL